MIIKVPNPPNHLGIITERPKVISAATAPPPVPTPVEILKQKRQFQIDAENAARAESHGNLIASLMPEIISHAGEEIIPHLTVRVLSEEPPVLGLLAKDHIEVQVKFSPLKFIVRQGMGPKEFDRLDDALICGQPKKFVGKGKPTTFNFNTHSGSVMAK